MVGLSGKTLGLDIGSSNIKWIVYGRSRKKPVIYNWGLIKTPPDAVRDGRIINRHRLQEMFAELLANNRVKAAKSCVTLSCPEMVIRTVEVPKMGLKELENAIKFEAEQFIPVNAGEYITDYKIIGEIEKDGAKLYRVLLAAVPLSIVQGYIELLESLNIKPGAIDFHGDSSSRFLSKYLPIAKESNYALLDIGASTTTITVAEQGVPVFTRVIQTGSQEITRSIANAFNLSLEDGEKYKKTYGRVFLEDEKHEDDMLGEMMAGIMPVVEYLLNDVYRSIEFYRTRTNMGIDSIILVGGGSYLKGIDKYFETQLNLRSRRVEGDLPFKVKNAIGDDQLLLFTNVLGLTFREER